MVWIDGSWPISQGNCIIAFIKAVKEKRPPFLSPEYIAPLLVREEHGKVTSNLSDIHFQVVAIKHFFGSFISTNGLLRG